MKILTSGRVFSLASAMVLIFACQPRNYNQGKFKDLVGGAETQVAMCSLVAPRFDSVSGDAKASVRVACQGQCRGVDYRNRKFYVINDEKAAGFEFSITLNNGRELRNLFVYESANGILQSLKNLTLENTDIQKSLQQYGLDSANVTKIAIPEDGKVLLSTGTRASLTNAGLGDGGTLDCGGEAIEGSVDLNQFKQQNVSDVKNAATAP